MPRTVLVDITAAATQPTLPSAPTFIVTLIPPSGVSGPPGQTLTQLAIPTTRVTFASVNEGKGWLARVFTRNSAGSDLLTPVSSAPFDVTAATPPSQTYVVAGSITVTLQ